MPPPPQADTGSRGISCPSSLQALLLDVSQSLLRATLDDAALDKGALARLIFDKVSQPLDADVCFNYRMERDNDTGSDTLVLVAGFGIPESFREGARQLDLGQAFCGTVADTRAPLRADRSRIQQDYKGAFVRAMGVRAYSSHPLFARDGRVIGTFSLASTRRDSFDPEEVDFLQTLCYLLSLAWERGDMERQIQGLNADLEYRIQARTAELQQSNEALLRSNMELQNFAQAIAHDLQTPLRSIVGFAQLLQQEIAGHVERQAEERLGYVIDNARRLQDLIRDLLFYSRLEAQERPFEATDFGKVFDQVMASLAIPIRERGAQVSRDDLPTVLADRTQMVQLLQNLIENGIKYNRAATPRVSVSCEHRDGEWIFSVADNGIGIAPRHRTRIFEIFRRLHTYDDIPGSGIGLAICERIVRRHGGQIWLESGSETGAASGSVFRFTLPERPEPAVSAGECGEQTASAPRCGGT